MSKLEENKVASRYAKALFEGALEAGQLDAVEADLESLRALFNQVPDLAGYLANPAIPASEKSQFAEREIAGKLNPWVGNLLRLMVDNNRIEAFPRLLEQFEALLNKHNNVAVAEVVTATELDDKLAEKLEKSLADRFGFNRVALNRRVEPGILGGVVVKIQDQVLDGSYSGRLEQLKKQLV